MAITDQVGKQVGTQVEKHLGPHVSPVVRWTLGHALPRVAVRGAAKRGDLHGRLIEATALGGQPHDVIETIRAEGPLLKSKFAYVTTSHAVVKEVLGSQDVRAGVDFSGTAEQKLQ